MPTERLYYADAYLTRFSAAVLARDVLGERPAVALDRSAFYPEGGGQPADHGTLGSCTVLDVQARAGFVWHILDRALESDAAEGMVNWARRFDHMQQHHGQHLLSAAFAEACGLTTTSFHLGTASATIDLDTAALTPDQAAAATLLANQVIWEDRPVLARFVTQAELAALPLRKAPTVDGPVRVVSVPDFDHSPCGGTHPRTTGAVGMVAIRGWARQKSGMRIEFVCGGRALADQRRMTGLLSELAASLSVAQDQLPAALERLRTAETTARRSLEAARDSLLDLEAQQLIAATATNGPPIVHAAFAGRDVGELRALALRIAAAGGVALLGLRAERPHLVFARAEGLPLDAAALLRSVLPLIGGKGGGQPALAQGSGTNPATLDAALAAAFAAAHASQ